MFKRILIAGAVVLLGIFLLPPAKEVAEQLADTASSQIPSYEPYAPFTYLVNDHIYLVLVVIWIAVILAILLWPTGDSSEIARK